MDGVQDYQDKLHLKVMAERRWMDFPGQTARGNAVTISELSKEINFDSKKSTAILKEYWKKDVHDLEILKLLVLFGANPTVLTNRFKNNEFESFIFRAKEAWRLQRKNETPPQSHPPAAKKPKKGANSAENNRIVLLALDGDEGPIGGMVASLMLRFVANRAFGHERLCEKVHWISGTGTGAIIALALIAKYPTRTLTDCLAFFWKLAIGNVFVKQHIKKSFTTSEAAKRLKVELKELFSDQNTLESRRCSDNPESQDIPRFCTYASKKSERKEKNGNIICNYLPTGQNHDVALTNLKFLDTSMICTASPKYFDAYTVADTKQSYYCSDETDSVELLFKEIENSALYKKKQIRGFISIGTGAETRVTEVQKSPKELQAEILIAEKERIDPLRESFLAIPAERRDSSFCRLTPGKILRDLHCDKNCGDEVSLTGIVESLWDVILYLTEQSTLDIIDQYKLDCERT